MSSGCGDVLSLQDLKTAKLHQIFEAEVITGKSGGVASGAAIDYATNPVTGQVQKTLPAILIDLGFTVAPFTFATGGTLTDNEELVLWPGPSGDGYYYQWHGAIPKVIPAASSPSSTGGIGPNAWVLNDTAGIRLEFASGTGDTMVGNKLDYPGTVVVTQRSRNNLNPSVLDFGADKSGVNDSAAAFIQSLNVPASVPVVVPAGTYRLTSNVDGVNHRFIFEEPVVFTGAGKLIRATVERITTAGISKISQWAPPGTTEPFSPSAVFGDNGNTRTGIQIGGAVPHNGSDGITLFSDGSAGWVGVKSSKWPHPTEMAIYPSTRSGSAQTIAGGNTVKVLTGASVTSADIGKPVAIYDSLYTVLGLTGDGFTVKNINGSAVSWTSTAVHTFVLCYYQGSGTCSISGTTVTRISGDPFIVPDPTVPQTMTINGVDYRVVSFADPQHVTLNTAPGDTSSTPYYFWGTVNSLNSALRVHRVNDAGFEENISVLANNAGYFAVHAGAGNPNNEQYPIYMGSGWDAAAGGQIRKSVILAGNGDVTAGGAFGVGPLYIPYATGETLKPQVKIDNSTGTAIVGVSSATADASLGLSAKGAGRIVTTHELVVGGASYPSTDNQFTSGRSANRWLQVWATNGTIQTSDERLKDFEDLSAAELNCGLALAREMKKFKWKDRSDDLNHFGVMAQKVISVFENNGLNALDYGVVLYAEDADIYSVSYAELNSLCIAALADRLLS